MPAKRDQTQRLGDGREDEVRSEDGGERHEMDPVGEIASEIRNDAQGEPGLADAARPRQRQESRG